MNSLRISKLIGLILLGLCGSSQVLQAQVWNPDHQIGSTSGTYYYSPGQTPAVLGEIYIAVIPNELLNYQWYSSTSPTTGFLPISNATSPSYQPPIVTMTSVTTYYFRVTSSSTAMPLNGILVSSISSNMVKIKVVSQNWEDINYAREHEVLNIGMTTWEEVDTMQIGSKLQTTTYHDGLNRAVEKVSKQTATPPTGSNTWGDMVQFAEFDVYGRRPTGYLPYTTTNQPGKYKTSPLTDQPAYFSNTATYNETSAFSTVTFDNSPVNRVTNVKSPGSSWAASAGNSNSYDMNTAADSVVILGTDYVQGDAPVYVGTYPVNSLYKRTFTDVNGNQVIEYTDVSGQRILRKEQVIPSPATGYYGWICTYFVYDDFGLLRFQIQPMGVQYLAANGWSFSGTNGSTVLAQQVFEYNYDARGRITWKKAPGASPLNMLYDIRDRLVFTQDGLQAGLSTPQWTAHLYDALDREVISTLFNTTETIASLQSDINSAAANTALSITAGANTGGGTVNVNLSLCPVSLNNTSLNSSTSTSVLQYQFYDNYSFLNVLSFNTNYNNLTAYGTSDPNVMPIATSLRTQSMQTGGMTRVLGTNVFLSSTSYFDEKGRNIQGLRTNIRSGVDINTVQYRWDGRVLSTCNSHTNLSAGYNAFLTLTKYIFDKIGRVVSVQKQLGSNAMKTAYNYDYDDVGRLKTKHLDPNYNNPNSGQPDLESLSYTYNIHDQLTGINKDYATKNPADYSKWGHFFGLYLGYDNKDNAFSHAQLNGQLGGEMWSTQGDDAQRRYDFTYDNNNRLTYAIYLETSAATPGTGWSSSSMDFRETGTNGAIGYDLNGNILNMMNNGVVPGTATPITIDKLTYTYNLYSNQLQSVTDNMNQPTLNGQFGDFKDGSNGSTPDYVYDANGNLVIDLNKNIQSLNNGATGTNGIHYNFMNKPDEIRLVGQGTIEIVYSAGGEKLQRVFIPETGGASTITTYIGGYIYQETSTTITTSTPAPYSGSNPQLAYITFEQGRIRVMTPANTSDTYDAFSENGNITLPAAPSGGGTSGAWDYFIIDNLGNTRMVLTEETHSAFSTCTMETSRASIEDPIFGQSGSGNEVEATRVATPTGWQSVNSSASCSGLGNLLGHNVGPNSLQKVMAGDVVKASAIYYFQNVSGNTNPNVVANILNSLTGAINGPSTVGTLVHSEASAIATELNGNSNFLSAVNPSSPPANTPQAYLTVLFFDERFNLVAVSDGGMMQQQVASTWSSSNETLGFTVQAPKNGYAYVYVSNLSDQSVFFDNLQMTITAGNIIEEDHYYPFGLKIAAISSHKLGDAGDGKLSNPFLYNGKEMLDENATLNWYDYGYRNYDPQIGRFVQLDPMSDWYSDMTPYQYAANYPVGDVDLDGLESAATAAADAAASAASAGTPLMQSATVIGYVKKAASSGSSWLSVTGSFLKGIGESVLGTLKAVGSMIIHPLETLKGIVQVIKDPVGTFNALKKVVTQTYHDFVNGTPEQRAQILGHLTGDIAQLFVGPAEVADLVKGITAAKDGAEAASKLAELARAAEEAAEEAKAIQKPVDAAAEAAKRDAEWNAAIAKKAEGHHLNPNQFKNDPAVKEAEKGGYNHQSTGENGNIRKVPKYTKDEQRVFHAYHPNWNQQWRAYEEGLQEDPRFLELSPADKAQTLQELDNWLIQQAKDGWHANLKLNEIKLDFSKFHPTTMP